MSNSIALLALEAADGTVVLTSITLVFAMLVALCLIITVEGKIFDAIKNKKNGTKAAPKAPAAPAAPAHRPAPEHRQGCSCRPRSTAADGSIPGEIVAAIAAAVASLGENLTIRGIHRVQKKTATGSRRGAWGDARRYPEHHAVYVMERGRNNGSNFYQHR